MFSVVVVVVVNNDDKEIIAEGCGLLKRKSAKEIRVRSDDIVKVVSLDIIAERWVLINWFITITFFVIKNLCNSFLIKIDFFHQKKKILALLFLDKVKFA